MVTITWERETLQARYDDPHQSPGTRLRLVSSHVGTLAHVVRYPGTLWRVYWNDGRMTDHPSESAAIRVVEKHFGL